MKKKLFTLGVGVLTCCVMTGCSAKIIDVNVIDEFSGDAVEIDFWHVFKDARITTLESLAESFSEEYSNITVNFKYSDGSYDGLKDDVELSIIDGTYPNITLGYPGEFVEYMEVDKVAPLVNFIEHDKWGFTDKDIEDFTFWEEGQVYDKYSTMYSLPLARSTEAFYVRTDYLDLINAKKEDIKTWDDVFEICSELKKLNNSEVPYSITYDDEANFALSLFGQSGAEFTNVNGEVTYINDKKNSDAKEVITEIIYDNKDYIIVSDEQYVYGSGFLYNNAVWASQGSTACGTYYDDIPNLEIIPVPQYSSETDDHYQISQGPSMAMLLSENDEENLASWLFMKYITETEASADFAVAAGYLPVRESSFQSDSYKAILNGTSNISKAANVAYDTLYSFESTAAFVGCNDARSEAGVMIINIVNKNFTVDEAFAKAKENLYLIL